jgi:hypothetical protein
VCLVLQPISNDFLFDLGVIYLKNMVTQNWQEREVEAGQPQVFHIHEQDRAMIRDAIVDAMVHAPDLVRYTSHHFYIVM